MPSRAFLAPVFTSTFLLIFFFHFTRFLSIETLFVWLRFDFYSFLLELAATTRSQRLKDSIFDPFLIFISLAAVNSAAWMRISKLKIIIKKQAQQHSMELELELAGGLANVRAPPKWKRWKNNYKHLDPKKKRVLCLKPIMMVDYERRLRIASDYLWAVAFEP